MSDSFEFTLHSPLSKEDWDKLTDVELENTTSITFQTPQGRQVKYIKCEVIDEIRNEIIQSIQNGTLKIEKGTEMLFRIIDLYKAESEEEE